MDGDGEAEFARPDGRDLPPGGRAIGRAEDAIVMLGPEALRRRPALDHLMHVLDRRVLGPLGGMNSAYMPAEVTRQEPQASSDCQTPPQETASASRRGSLGSMHKECTAGASLPPPTQAARFGWFQRLSTSAQLSPPSPERKRPPAMVPAHSVASGPAAEVQITSTLGPSLSSSCGKAGQPISRQEAPRSSDRCSLAPKCPSLSAA